jgi:class 3 adenylate cyclase
MEPRIQYAKTADGVSIAFWTLGEGMPVVQLPVLPWSHIEMGWQDPGWRRWYERWREKRKLVRYDGRGTGLSQRSVADYSVEAHMLDLQAVVERLRVQRFVLVGPSTGAAVAIAYAARHPKAVLQLVLWCPWAREGRTRSRTQAFRALLQGDWELYTEAVAHASLGWSTGEEAHLHAAFLRECADAQAARAIFRGLAQSDVKAVLSQVRSPTLVVQRRQVQAVGVGGVEVVEVARALASGILHARLALLEGESILPWVGDMDAALSAIDEFLGEEEEATSPAAPAGLVTILFTDMEGSTALTQRLGDAKAQEVLRAHNSIVREALKAHGGSEIKHTGDGIMASFPSASGALECAIAIQRAFEEYNAALLRQAQDAHTEPVEVRVRIGLNAGEPIQEEKDLFGTAVQLAARVCAHAEPGQILVPTVVRELAAGKGFLMADLGEIALRGFEDPVRLYEVRWEEDD